MRKRRRRAVAPKSSKLTTLIIMIVMLAAILIFGKQFSQLLAQSFVTEPLEIDALPQKIEVSDDNVPTVESPESHHDEQQGGAKKEVGVQLSDIHQESAQEIIKLLVPQESE